MPEGTTQRATPPKPSLDAHLEVFLLAASAGWVSSVPSDWVHSKWVCSEPGGRPNELKATSK